MITMDRYRLLRQIGQGGQGEIYLAYDEKLAMKKVVKILQEEDSECFSLRRQQFISEILLMKDLQHPCLPHISDLVIEKEGIMLVMDYVEGDTLQEYIEKHGAQEESVVIQWGIQLAEFFEYLHGRQPPVIHRDIKPSNIIYHSSGRLVLLDFGIASVGRKENGWCQGTEGYAAPEQYDPSGICDERTDLYALGRTLLYCLTGKNLENPLKISIPFYNNISFYNISYDMRKILGRCTCRQKEGRFENITELKQHLCSISSPQSELLSFRQRLRPYAWKTICGIVLGITVLLFFGEMLKEERSRREALSYVDYAWETSEEKKMLSFFDRALQEAPSETAIYEGILECYLKPQHFSHQALVKVLNLYEKNQALPLLKRKNPGYYGVYCYEMGIGYFYGKGGSAGKRESELWFSRAITYEKKLTESQRRRARIYNRISDYYQSFLMEGEDPSGEKEEESYREFFETLQELNKECALNSSSPVDGGADGKKKADQRASFSGMMEVAEEIREYGEAFLKEGVEAEDLLNELEGISCFCRKEHNGIAQEEKEELMKLVAAARKRIQIMEEYHE